jgi:Ca-activated chloride channel homolog
MGWLDLFLHPIVLLALLLLPALPRGRGRRWRMAALAALIVALAQPQLPAEEDRITVLIDVSASVGENARTLAAPLVASIGEGAAIILFAGDASRVDGVHAPAPAGLDLGRSDIGRALEVAIADGAGRVLLISDGVDTRFAGTATLPTAAVPVDVVVAPRRPNGRLEALWAPERIAPGGEFEAIAVVTLDLPARLTLRPEVAGAPLPPLTFDLPAGRHTLPFEVQSPATGSNGTHLSLGATIAVDFEQPLEDDQQRTEVRVASTAPVMVIGDPAFAELLRVQGFEVEEVGPERVRSPFNPSALVVRAGVAAFTPGQLELLARYVDLGGGLLMTGGPEGFGLGGWYRTPVEGVLPVGSDVRTEVTTPQVAMVIVLDISQSMAAGNPNRLEIAKQGVVDVIDLAYQEDLLGLVVFSDPTVTRWVFELRPATDSGKRTMRDATLAIRPQGGTILLPGYSLALEALRSTDAAIKHVIVLSDGKLFDGSGPLASGAVPDWEALAAVARSQRITTSSVAIGADADSAALSALARGGGGRYYEAFDVRTLPQLFTAEALTATRDLLRREATTPVALRHPLSPFEGPLPAVDAYIATTLKPDAEPLLRGRDGEPLLAVGRAGLGRSAAFTSDLNAWAGEFGGWAETPALLAGVVRWLQARPAPYSASLTPRGNLLEVVVDAVVDGMYVNDRTLVARYLGAETTLVQVGPGRYAGSLPVRGSGGTVVISDGAEVVARRAVATPDPEFAPARGEELLALVAERSGGDVIDPTLPYTPPRVPGSRGLWPFAALLALLLTLAEFALRRYGAEASPSSGSSTSTLSNSRKSVVA